METDYENGKPPLFGSISTMFGFERVQRKR